MYITQGQFNTIAFYQMYFKRFKYAAFWNLFRKSLCCVSQNEMKISVAAVDDGSRPKGSSHLWSCIDMKFRRHWCARIIVHIMWILRVESFLSKICNSSIKLQHAWKTRTVLRHAGQWSWDVSWRYEICINSYRPNCAKGDWMNK